MNKANECTCPSGDGSLRHPCPAHPAVEQAGGDERVIGWRERILAAHPNSDPGFWTDALLVEHMAAEIADLRAALAQPSSAQAEQHWPKLEKPAQVGAIRFRAGLSSRLVVEAAQRLYEFESTPEKEAERIERLQAFREQCFEPLGAEFSKVLSENLVELSSEAKPEQAEAERPEVVAYLFVKPDGTLSMDAVRHKPSQPAVAVMTVAQHERIVGELRAAHQITMDELHAMEVHVAQAGREIDAALARVAELEMLLRKLSTNGLMQFSTVDEEMAVQAALGGAPVAQAQHSVPDGYRLIRLEHFAAIKAKLNPEQVNAYRGRNIYDEDKVYANWNACRSALDEIKDVLQQIDWDAENELAELLAAAPGNSAQHSVPGDIMRDAQRYRWLRDQQFYFSFSTENSDAGISSCTAGMSSRFKNLSWVDAAIDSAIAAAPGKEGV
ncbi:TPA: hypothetical protein SL833_002752 [Pseudomonas aeruginosa]|nr:hypothetical protein [Pseudomonas aeruginosa]